MMAFEPGDQLGKKVEKLFEEVQAVKMLSLQEILRSQGNEGVDQGQEGLKHAQMVLKSIEIQLRIIIEQLKGVLEQQFPPGMEALWMAMYETSCLKPLLKRSAVREEIMANLRKYARQSFAPSPQDEGDENVTR